MINIPDGLSCGHEKYQMLKIITVTYAAYSLAKRRPENIQAYRNTKPDLNDTGATLLPIKLTNQMGAAC